MPTLSQLTLNNGVTPPIGIVFDPSRRETSSGPTSVSLVGWEARSLTPGVSSPLSYGQFTYTFSSPSRPPSSQKGAIAPRVYKSKLKFTLPTVSVVPGSSAVQLTQFHSAELTFIMPEGGSVDDRKNLIAFVRNALSASAIAGSVEKLEGFF